MFSSRVPGETGLEIYNLVLDIEIATLSELFNTLKNYCKHHIDNLKGHFFYLHQVQQGNGSIEDHTAQVLAALNP